MICLAQISSSLLFGLYPSIVIHICFILYWLFLSLHTVFINIYRVSYSVETSYKSYLIVVDVSFFLFTVFLEQNLSFLYSHSTSICENFVVFSHLSIPRVFFSLFFPW